MFMINSFFSSSYKLKMDHISILTACWDAANDLILSKINRIVRPAKPGLMVTNSGNFFLSWVKYQSKHVIIVRIIVCFNLSDLVTS